MSRVWFNEFSSGAGRFVRMDGARGVLLRPDTPLIARAAAFAILFTLVIIAGIIIIPLIVLAGVLFLASLGYLKMRRFFGRLFNALPRDDGRRNVRVRLPADSSES